MYRTNQTRHGTGGNEASHNAATTAGPAIAAPEGNADTGSVRTKPWAAQHVIELENMKVFGEDKDKCEKAIAMYSYQYIKKYCTNNADINFKSTQEMYKELEQSTYRIHVIPAQMFEDAMRHGHANIFELDYTYIHPANSSYIIAIPVYRNGYINSIDMLCNNNPRQNNEG